MKKYIPYIIICVLLVAGYLVYNKIQKENAISNQNLNAELDSLCVVEDGLYKKLAFIETINDSLSKKIKKFGEEIIYKNSLIIELKNQISEGFGTIDTHYVYLEECKGVKLNFAGENSFRKYDLLVTVDNPPYHKLIEKYNPFALDVYLSRNKKGLYSGYVKVEDKYSEYIKIKDINVVMERDEFVIEKKQFLSLRGWLQANLHNGSIYAGASGEFFEKYSVGYLGNFFNEHSVILGYRFF